MASNYPGSLDSFDTIASDKKTSDSVGGRTHRDMHNDLGDAIEAVQTELGTAPSGSYTTVRERFEAIEGATLPAVDAKGDLVVGTADNTYDNLTVGANNTVLVADSAQTKGVKWGTTVGVWTVAGLHVGYAAKTSAYTATTSDDVLNVTSGTFTLDLPAASGATGKTLKVKNAGTGVVTLDGNSAETIEGVATFPLGPGSYVEITSTGSAWILTGGVPNTGWRDVTASITGWTNVTVNLVHVRRVGSMVLWRFSWNASGTASGTGAYTTPTGFRYAPAVTDYEQAFHSASSGTFKGGVATSSGGDLSLSHVVSQNVRAQASYSTTDTWPTSLPGSAV